MLHSLCYRQMHLDFHTCVQFAKTGGELGAGGWAQMLVGALFHSRFDAKKCV